MCCIIKFYYYHEVIALKSLLVCGRPVVVKLSFNPRLEAVRADLGYGQKM